MNDQFAIVTFRRGQMADFYDWILPDVYMELLATEDFSEEGIIALGALNDGRPCGAAVCFYVGGEAFNLGSIIVDETVRRQGIGSALLEAAENEALAILPPVSYDPPVKQTELKVTYVMPEAQSLEADAFFQACGFRGFSTEAPVFLFEAAQAGEALLPLKAFAELPDEAPDELVEEYDLPVEPELSFFAEDSDGEEMLFLTSPAGDHSYFLISSVNGSAGKAAYAQALLSVLQKIGEADGDATVLASALSQPYADVFERLARERGQICLHREASCYVSLRMDHDDT